MNAAEFIDKCVQHLSHDPSIAEEGPDDPVGVLCTSMSLEGVHSNTALRDALAVAMRRLAIQKVITK